MGGDIEADQFEAFVADFALEHRAEHIAGFALDDPELRLGHAEQGFLSAVADAAIGDSEGAFFDLLLVEGGGGGGAGRASGDEVVEVNLEGGELGGADVGVVGEVGIDVGASGFAGLLSEVGAVEGNGLAGGPGAVGEVAEFGEAFGGAEGGEDEHEADGYGDAEDADAERGEVVLSEHRFSGQRRSGVGI